MIDVGDLHADLEGYYFFFLQRQGLAIVHDGDWILYQVKEQMPFVIVRIHRIDLFYQHVS